MRELCPVCDEYENPEMQRLVAKNEEMRLRGDELAGQLQAARGGLGGIWHYDALRPMEQAVARWRETLKL